MNWASGSLIASLSATTHLYTYTPFVTQELSLINKHHQAPKFKEKNVGEKIRFINYFLFYSRFGRSPHSFFISRSLCSSCSLEAQFENCCYKTYLCYLKDDHPPFTYCKRTVSTRNQRASGQTWNIQVSILWKSGQYTYFLLEHWALKFQNDLLTLTVLLIRQWSKDPAGKV